MCTYRPSLPLKGGISRNIVVLPEGESGKVKSELEE